MFAKLDKKLDSFLTMGIPWYDCVVYHKGKRVYRRYAGTLDLEGKMPVGGDELINIYSCSKVITCTAALMLYEKGAFALTDALSLYLPEYAEMTVKGEDGTVKKAETPITVLDLFRMTAGFSYALWTPALRACREETGGVCNTRDFARYLAKDPLVYEPGESWQYSLAHDVLAALVEVLSGMNFDDFCQKYIFTPLGMKHTTFLLPYIEYERVAPHYSYNAEEGKCVACSKRPCYRIGEGHASGGAGCVSTVDDYIAFLEGLRTEKLLKRETLDLMETDLLTDKQRAAHGVGDYGYGLGVRCPRAGSPVTDFGWGGAAGAYLMIDRKNEITAFYAQHVLASPVQAVRGEIRPVITEILCGKDAARGESDKSKY